MGREESIDTVDAIESGLSDDTIRVAHLTTVDSSLRYLLLPQLLALRDLGWVAIGISGPGPDVEFLHTSGVRHIPLKSSTRSKSVLADLRAALELREILRSETIDVLHTHNPKPGIYGRIVGRLSGVPIVVNTVHGLYASPEDGLWKRAVVYTLEWIASRFSDAELVQSREDVETMSRLRIGSPKWRFHLGNGIDLKRFSPNSSPESKQRIRKVLGLTDEAVVVGCVARLVAEKGIPELMEAYADRTSEYELVVVGPADPSKADALTNSQIEAASRMGVRFLGHRDDVEDLYHALDLFVLPSHREGFPRAAMEAAASGLPIIATDVRGCREVVSDGENGLLVPKLDATRLARAIDHLVENSAERSRMSAVARRKAEAEFDEVAVVRRVLATYKQVAASKDLVRIARMLEKDAASDSTVGD